MTKTEKQKQKAECRKAIALQNKSSRKMTIKEAIKEVRNVSDDV